MKPVDEILVLPVMAEKRREAPDLFHYRARHEPKGGVDERASHHFFRHRQAFPAGHGRIRGKTLVQPAPAPVPMHRRQYPVLRVTLPKRGQRADGVRRHPCVLVDKEHSIVPARQGFPETDVIGGAETQIGPVLHEPHGGVTFPYYLNGTVRRTVVHHHDVRRVSRAGEAVQTPGQPRLEIVRHDNRQYTLFHPALHFNFIHKVIIRSRSRFPMPMRGMPVYAPARFQKAASSRIAPPSRRNRRYRPCRPRFFSYGRCHTA